MSPESRSMYSTASRDLAASHLHPDNLRSGCDYIGATFVLDDYADVAEPAIVNTICEGILHAVEHVDEPRPQDEHIIVELMRQYVASTPGIVNSTC